MARFHIPWRRLLPRHQRVAAFWIISGLAIALPWLFSGASRPPARSCTVNSIHDGDTLRATCEGWKVKIRLYCIDAPEIDQRPWGIEARDHLRAIASRSVRVVERDRDRDRYGRLVGEVFAGERSLNLAMVRDGYAAVYPKYCKERRYYAEERRAKSADRGIWANAGEQQRPWEWRHRWTSNHF